MTGLHTRAVHAGAAPDPHGAPHPPLYDHTTFVADGGADAETTSTRRAFYTRYGDNPTLWAVEDKIAALHAGQQALVFGSGMAAMSASLLSLLRPGQHVVVIGGLYGGTQELLDVRLGALGIPTVRLATADVGRVHEIAPATTRAVLVESPSNPLLELTELQQAADAAHDLGARLVVDNTFASPVNQRPLLHGADLVVESATKFLGGHSDLAGGVVVGATEPVEQVAGWRTSLGQVMAPDIAHRLSRSLRTLPVRVARQNDTAATVAAWLAARPDVRHVHHPSLATGRDREVRDRQMDGPGGMLSFEVDGGEAASRLLERLRLILVAPSLGGVETLATRPSVTSHRDVTTAERRRLGIADGLVRLSVGLEDVDDLIADLDAALTSS